MRGGDRMHFEKLAEALGCTPGWLMGWDAA